MDGGFYPHTVRIDPQDRVWFTLALSSRVAMFDRSGHEFSYYDLPPRGLTERLILWLAQWRLGSGNTGEPPEYDRDNNGVHDFASPLERGISGVTVQLLFDANRDGDVNDPGENNP